jgi:hypothetical protein
MTSYESVLFHRKPGVDDVHTEAKGLEAKAFYVAFSTEFTGNWVSPRRCIRWGTAHPRRGSNVPSSWVVRRTLVVGTTHPRRRYSTVVPSQNRGGHSPTDACFPIHRKSGVRPSPRTHVPIAKSHRKPGVSLRHTRPLDTVTIDAPERGEPERISPEIRCASRYPRHGTTTVSSSAPNLRFPVGVGDVRPPRRHRLVHRKPGVRPSLHASVLRRPSPHIHRTGYFLRYRKHFSRFVELCFPTPRQKPIIYINDYYIRWITSTSYGNDRYRIRRGSTGDPPADAHDT